MEVNHSSDHITHAVVGGKKPIKFGISDDPAFFQILSSALYKDPMLAMVRETICNAWDAHIDAGLTDKAVSITLDDDYLTIQDSGLGIHDDHIGPIYGIYGASTKKQDGRQTGGFGLGCKSPFAYNDHFEVISCHENVKTIYNMSKSSAELNGKPSIVPIASFPTNQRGITVKIPLNPNKQNFRLNTMIQEVVFNGDIKAELNGDDLPILGLDGSEHGFILINSRNTYRFDHLIRPNTSPIWIRYGNVIYPLENSPDYENLFEMVEKSMNQRYRVHLVLQAPADSISITPSRESLNLSEVTIATVADLLGKFLAVMGRNTSLLHRHKEMVNECIDNAADAAEKLPINKRLPLDDWSIPGVDSHLTQETYSSTEELAKMEVTIRYSSSRGLGSRTWLKAINRYMRRVNQKGAFDRGAYQVWLRTAQNNIGRMTSPVGRRNLVLGHEGDFATEWWRKNVLAQLVENLSSKVPDFDRNSLFYRSPNSGLSIPYNKPVLNRVKNSKIYSHTLNIAHLLKPTVILTHNFNTVMKRLSNNPDALVSTGTMLTGTYFVYEVPRKKSELVEIKKGFDALEGIEYLDLTGRLPYEEQEYQQRKAEIAAERSDRAAGRPTKTRLVKKIKPGMIRLDSLLDGNRMDTTLFTTTEDPKRIVDPKIVHHISTAKNATKSILHQYRGEKLSLAITKLYGDQIGVSVRRDTIERMVKNEKAELLEDFLFRQITHDIENLPTLVAHHSSNMSKINDYLRLNSEWGSYLDMVKMVQLLNHDPDLKALVPAMTPLSEDDAHRWLLWEDLSSNCNYSKRAGIRAVAERVEAIPLNPEIIKFLKKLIANQFLDLIDVDCVFRKIRRNSYNPDQKKKLVELLTSILN